MRDRRQRIVLRTAQRPGLFGTWSGPLSPDRDQAAGAHSTINGHVKVQIAPGGLHLGDIDTEKVDRVGFEPHLRLLVSTHLRLSADAMSMKTAVQGRARQLRDRCRKSVEAVVERPEGMSAEGDNHRFPIDRKNRRCWRPGASWPIRGRGPLLPLRASPDLKGSDDALHVFVCASFFRSEQPALIGPCSSDGLLVDPVTLRRRLPDLLIVLYYSTGSRCRRGDPMTNAALTHPSNFAKRVLPNIPI